MSVMRDPKDAIGVHEHIYNAISQVAPQMKGLRILEVGAGYQDKAKWASVSGTSPVWFIPDLFPLDDYRYETIDLRPECGCTKTGNAEQLDKYYEADAFDVMLCFETLEHTLDPVVLVSQMWRALKMEGALFLSVPFTMGHHTPRDLWRWTEDGLRYMLLREGFNVEKMLPLGGEQGREWSWMAIGRKVPRGSLGASLAAFNRL